MTVAFLFVFGLQDRKQKYIYTPLYYLFILTEIILFLFAPQQLQFLSIIVLIGLGLFIYNLPMNDADKMVIALTLASTAVISILALTGALLKTKREAPFLWFYSLAYVTSMLIILGMNAVLHLF